MSRSVVAFSGKADLADAFEEVSRRIDEETGGISPILILFTSDFENFTACARRFAQKYPDAQTMGMTSYVNFSSEGYSMKGVSALAICSGIEVATNVLLEITHYPMRYAPNIEQAVDEMCSKENCCCISFTTAFGGCEELVQDTFKSVLGDMNIPVFGGTSGVGERFSQSFVALNGITYSEATVFAVIHNSYGRIRIFRENMFKPTEHFFMATDVDCDERTVYEYDDRPAAEVIAHALHTSVTDLQEQMFMHPIGRVEGGNIYITEVNKVEPDGRVTYYSRIYNRTKVVQLEVEDLDEVWERTAFEVRKEEIFGSFAIVINCLSRSRYFIEQGRFGDFNDKLKKEYGDYVGMSGYGEQSDFEHLNQTMLLAIFE